MTEHTFSILSVLQYYCFCWHYIIVMLFIIWCTHLYQYSWQQEGREPAHTGQSEVHRSDCQDTPHCPICKMAHRMPLQFHHLPYKTSLDHTTHQYRDRQHLTFQKNSLNTYTKIYDYCPCSTITHTCMLDVKLKFILYKFQWQTNNNVTLYT